MPLRALAPPLPASLFSLYLFISLRPEIGSRILDLGCASQRTTTARLIPRDSHLDHPYVDQNSARKCGTGNPQNLVPPRSKNPNPCRLESMLESQNSNVEMSSECDDFWKIWVPTRETCGEVVVCSSSAFLNFPSYFAEV